MTAQLALATLFGGFTFAFVIRMCWGKLAETMGPIGGFVAGAMISGTTWMLNHGCGMIYQSGTAWVDMAWAAGVGLFAANIIVDKADAGKGAVNALVAILGGLFGGFIMSCFGQ